jgi:hypothetical protein
MTNITDINKDKSPVIYAVRIAHYWDGRIEYLVEDVAYDSRSRNSIAEALRKMADAMDASQLQEPSK